MAPGPGVPVRTGAGPLFDLGPYYLSALAVLFGPAEFRTDYPGVEIPHIRAQYPQRDDHRSATPVLGPRLQPDTKAIQVGLSFGGVPSKLVIPLDAVVEFADPHIRYGLRFQAADSPAAEAPPAPAAEAEPAPEAKDAEPGQVVSLDAFRRRQP